jgi:hypothetical protein
MPRPLDALRCRSILETRQQPCRCPPARPARVGSNKHVAATRRQSSRFELLGLADCTSIRPCFGPERHERTLGFTRVRGIVTCHCYAHRRAPSVRGPTIVNYTCFHHLDISCNTSQLFGHRGGTPRTDIIASSFHAPDPATHRQPG